jgi:hypothetical protein
VHDANRGGLVLLELKQDRHAIGSRHHQIRDHHGEGFARDQCQCFFAARGRGDAPVGLIRLQNARQRSQRHRVIVHE